jgi:hypothetical protein
VVIGSMNRCGLQKAAFELDDRFTAYRAPTLAAMGFEGGKMLLRVDLDDPATAPTLESAGAAVSELAAAGLMAMIEPFMAHRVEGRVHNLLTAPAMATAISIAAGLGDSSAHTWLKVPIVAEMERAVAATTLPCVVLGGEVSEDPSAAYGDWARALALPNVHGLVVGRALLFPPDDDVAAAVRSAVEVCASTRPGGGCAGSWLSSSRLAILSRRDDSPSQATGPARRFAHAGGAARERSDLHELRLVGFRVEPEPAARAGEGGRERPVDRDGRERVGARAGGRPARLSACRPRRRRAVRSGDLQRQRSAGVRASARVDRYRRSDCGHLRRPAGLDDHQVPLEIQRGAERQLGVSGAAGR